jgi:hypothetical protein
MPLLFPDSCQLITSVNSNHVEVVMMSAVQE